MPDGFAEVYREHVAPVWRYVRVRVPSDADAEDVTSQVFERAIASWGGYDAARGGVGGWLVGIARHTVADWWRKHGRELPTDQAVDGTADDDPEGDVLRRQGADEVRRLLGVLTPRSRPAAGGDGRVSEHDDDFETAVWLSTALRPEPPAALVDRIDRMVAAPAPVAVPAPPWRWPLVALAACFWVHGFGSVFLPGWLIENLGEDAPHALFEGGVATLTVAVLLGAGALRRSWAPVAAAGGAPMGVIYGVHGIREWGSFAWGAALHTLEGVLALVVLVTFLLAWRDRKGVRREGRA